MRRIAFIAALLIFTSSFFLSVSSAVIRDDFSSNTTQNDRVYNNLLLNGNTDVSSGALGVIANPMKPRASVIYRVQNASRITVQAYLATGTVVTRNEEGTYTLAPQAVSGGAPANTNAKISSSENRVYISADNGAMYLTYDKYAGYIFKPVSALPKDLTPYGVSISYSTDGKSFSAASQRRTKSDYNSGAKLCIESWTANIPKNAEYIKVELADVSFIEDFSSGEPVYKPAFTMPMLSVVEIEGENLIEGAPQEIKKEESITQKPESSQEEKVEKEEKKEPTKKTASSVKVAPTPVPAPESTKEEKSSSESSKFEGSVVVKENNKKASDKSSKEPANAKVENHQNPEEQEESMEQEEIEQVFYVAPQEKTDDSFTKWMIVYITVVSIAIFIIILRPSKK